MRSYVLIIVLFIATIIYWLVMILIGVFTWLDWVSKRTEELSKLAPKFTYNHTICNRDTLIDNCYTTDQYKIKDTCIYFDYKYYTISRWIISSPMTICNNYYIK